MRKFQCSDCGYKFTRQVRIHFASLNLGVLSQGRADILESLTWTKCETLVLHLFFPSQAHLRRHVQVHKRTENYNPRQRKLRNVIVQEVDMNPSEHEHPGEADASMTSEDRGYIPEAIKESTNPEANPDGGLQPGCIHDGIDSRHMVMEEVVTNQDLREDVAAESFSVSEVLQQTQLVDSYGSEMVQSISESKN